MRPLKFFRRLLLNYRVVLIGFLFLTMICSPTRAQADINDLSTAISTLKGHITGDGSYLSAGQITEQTEIIKDNIALIGQNDTIISQAFEVVEIYETKVGPLFINAQTSSGFPRDDYSGVEFDWAMFQIQQGLLDYAYTAENIEQYDSLLNGAKFLTSEYFPGDVAPPADPDSIYQVKIKCTMREVWWGSPVMYCQDYARRPTGAYLAPGSIAKVIVPDSIVGKGFKIRVGAHSWDLSNKPRYKRLHRVSLTYPIDSTVVEVANPLGGGIYIEVPYKADGGVQTIEFKNTVRSPFFSARSFDKTTLEEWQNEERHHPGPWADFESDKFMMQIPTKWIYNYDDPVSLMEDWDKAMDGVSELFGLPLVRNITVLYLQTDVMIRGGAYYPGYPQSNITYSPTRLVDGNKNHFLLKGPQYSSHVLFHELGHSQLFTKFQGEVEAVVNLPYVAVQNDKFGMPLDEAFGRSFANPNMSLDQAAMTWMVTRNFRQGNPMNITNSTHNQVRYQHRGYGKYVEIARLFGWDALSRFWHSVHEDYLDGITYPRNSDPTDSRILRMSKAAGADLTPLIHFWGIQPENPEALKEMIDREGIQKADTIYHMLKHYQSIVPMNNEEFLEHANTIYPNGLREAHPDYGVGWYYEWAPRYSEEHGDSAVEALQDIIDHYFPEKEAPGVPDSLKAIAGEGNVSLSWYENTDVDLEDYHVYRSTNQGSGYTLVDSTSRLNYTDDEVNINTTYYYVITAGDTWGNESGFSSEVSATPYDKTSPEIPDNLVGTVVGDSVNLTWDENGEGDLAGYYVYRATPSSASFIKLNTSVVEIPAYIDNNAPGGNVYYKVSAVDTVDNESELSSPTIVTLPENDTVTTVFGVNEESPGIKVFPNPYIDGELFVEWGGMSDRVTIVVRNLSGMTVYQEQVSGSRTSIPAERISESGVFIISVEGVQNKFNTKLLVK